MTPSSTTRLVPFITWSSMVMVTPTWRTGPPGARTNEKGWEENGQILTTTDWNKRTDCLTWKKATVIHFLLLLSFLYFSIYFLLFSSESETIHNINNNITKLLTQNGLFFIPTSNYSSVIQVQHLLESKDPKRERTFIPCVVVILRMQNRLRLPQYLLGQWN